MAKNTAKSKATNEYLLADVISTDAPDVKIDVANVSGKSVKIDDSAMIKVKSNVFGSLIYIDKKTGEEKIWDSCGSVISMPFGELRTMKANAVNFFVNQWVIICGFEDEDYDEYTTADIYKALYITNYYKNIIDPSDYETICSWKASEVKEKVSYMTKEAKENLVVALNTYIDRGVLDSIRTIKAFEEALGCKLVSRE